MEDKAEVNKIITFSNVDGPGNRTAIFFQGCDIKCVYCHNPETQRSCIRCMECVKKCPTKAITEKDGKIIFNEKICAKCDRCIKTCPHDASPRTRLYTVKELFDNICEYKEFIRGITVSGGEPTLHSDFITELFKMVKPLGLTCFVDSNGFFDRKKIANLINETDKFMIDIKAVDNIEKVCCTDKKNNMDNLLYLLKMNKVYEVRTVLINGYIDTLNTVKKVSYVLKDYPDVIYKLIRVHSAGLKDEQKEKIKDKIPSKSEVIDLAKMAGRIGVQRVKFIV